jgi:cytochrome c2
MIMSAARRTVLTVAATAACWTWTVASGQAATGAEIYNNVCVACHSIGGGKRIGPDLKGIHERRSEEWLVKFIASSQTVVKSGDPVAVALFDEFKIVMPDFPFTAVEIKSVLAFIRSGGDGTALPQLRAATPEDIPKGQGLFEGTIRFVNRGPACNSCHHVKNDAVIGGGVLAAELTSVFTRMSGPGIQAILGKPPFPVMEQAFKDKALTEDEVVALVAFLQDADAKQSFQQPRDYGVRLLYSGAGGFVVLMAAYSAVWRRRRTRPVNHRVFDRQVKSR